jgi:hypothetical protein
MYKNKYWRGPTGDYPESKDWINTQGAGASQTSVSADWFVDHIKTAFNNAECSFCKDENGVKKTYSVTLEKEWLPVDIDWIKRNYQQEEYELPKTRRYPRLKVMVTPR